ncbi:rRNA processing/ribosome biogenesis-domain-containing protein [Crassisporium funariophilum]|nr:rRNA processing/ribosome biogenesis-domain-containing protein [Crassisporium funariophilum]
MEAGSHLKALLQTQLASDISAVRYLPYTITSLTSECFLPSPHLTKWITRINALLHSKDSGARWAGLCLAYKTSLLSQSMMIESAQSWLAVALPLLSRSEPIPTLKAAIRLLRTIFTTASDITEFHRQVLTPNVAKFSAATIAVAESHPDAELKVSCMETLTSLIPLYPTTHRASHAALSAFSLRYLNGSATSPTNSKILGAASKLYGVLHLTGGKVGSVAVWRKSLEETLAFGREAFFCLRTTFPGESQTTKRPITNDEPHIFVPLNLDRLRCSVIILCDLLSTIVQRPVQVPIGNLIKFTSSLLRCSKHEQIDGFKDPMIRELEITIVPEIWVLGCELLVCLAERLNYRLDSHLNTLVSILTFQLEQNPNQKCRLSLLKALNALLDNCHAVDSSFVPTRLAKVVLPSIANIFSSSSGESSGEHEASSSKSKKGKKRARNFEGDEVFKVSRKVVCPTMEEGEVLLTSIDVTRYLFRNPNLSSAMRSVIARIIISILLALPRMSPASISPNPALIQIIQEKVQSFGIIIGSSTTSVMSKSLPFVIEATLASDNMAVQSDIGILLHPRVPPLVRSMPHVEALSLFKAEETEEEVELLLTLGLQSTHLHPTPDAQDVLMNDQLASIPQSNAPKTVSPAVEQKETPAIPLNIPPAKTLPSQVTVATSDDAFKPSTITSQLVPHALEYRQAPNKKANEPIPSSEVIPIIAADDEDEDEEMPFIDMASDSEDGDED